MWSSAEWVKASVKAELGRALYFLASNFSFVFLAFSYELETKEP